MIFKNMTALGYTGVEEAGICCADSLAFLLGCCY